MKCLYCSKEIQYHHVACGGMHMGCFNEEISLFKITLDGTSYWDDKLPDDENNEYIIENVTLPRGAFYYMKDFEGF